MKKLLFVFLLSISASAETLDSVIKTLNLQLNPKLSEQTGIEIDYKESSDEHVWINILRVKLICKNENRVYLKNKILQTKTVHICDTKIDDTINKNTLFQIVCQTARGSKCKELMSKNINVDIIRTIVNRGILDIYLE